MVRPAFDITQLTVAERLQLIEELWASLASRPEAVPLTEAQLALVSERRAEHARAPEGAIPWETVRAELLADQEADERAGAGKRQG
jgi:putative addiction module component (TIGR02574 family)